MALIKSPFSHFAFYHVRDNTPPDDGDNGRRLCVQENAFCNFRSHSLSPTLSQVNVIVFQFTESTFGVMSSHDHLFPSSLIRGPLLFLLTPPPHARQTGNCDEYDFPRRRKQLIVRLDSICASCCACDTRYEETGKQRRSSMTTTTTIIATLRGYS